MTFSGHEGAVTGIGLSRDGVSLVTGGRDGTVRVWSTSTGKALAKLAVDRAEVTSVAVDDEARLILAGSSDGKARLWDVTQNQVIGELGGHQGRVDSVALSLAVGLAATGSEDRTVRLWDIATRAEKKTFGPHPGRVTAVAITPAGDRVVAGSGTSARVWSVATGKLVFPPLIGHKHSVLTVAVSADGRWLATGSRDRTILVYDLTAGKRKHRFQLAGHADDVTSVAFTDDASRLISGSADGTVRLWDVATGTQIAAIRIGIDIVGTTAVAVSSSGGRLAIAMNDGRTVVVPLFPGAHALIEAARAAVPRCLAHGAMKMFHLDGRPPRWCITGGRAGHPPDAMSWAPRWPFQSEQWRNWLIAIDRGETPSLPEPE
jgi:WD40 repeat protein